MIDTLNPSKACGPDEIPNWPLKEYAELLAVPVSKIINFSFKEQRLRKIWKFANISPLPKVKPVEDLEKNLCPISPIPCLPKVAEEFIVVDYVKCAVLKVLDPSQYGAAPKLSTTQALIHMIHHWTEGCDGNGATVRITLYNYKKAFDFIDHKILVRKLRNLDLPIEIVNWVIDFLSDCSQRICPIWSTPGNKITSVVVFSAHQRLRNKQCR